jgi:hypothetical protein
MGPWLAVIRVTAGSYDHSARDERHYEEDQEDHEQDFGKFCGNPGDAAEAECSRDESDQQED